MAPNLKWKLDTFKQLALMFSFHRELTTQALEIIWNRKPAIAMRPNASTSSEQGVSCNGVNSPNNINVDTTYN